MTSWLDALVERTAAVVGSLPDAREAPLEAELASREGRQKDRRVTMRSRAWRSRTQAWFRCAAMDGGEGVRVLSCLGLGRDPFDLPTFAAEIVEIRGEVRLIALDWIHTDRAVPYGPALAPVRARFQDVPPGGELPAWAARAFSPHALFSRPSGRLSHVRIAEAYGAYLDGFRSICADAVPRGDPAAHRAAREGYCADHASNDPGGRMLASIFGSSWAERYAREVLFRLDDADSASASRRARARS